MKRGQSRSMSKTIPEEYRQYTLGLAVFDTVPVLLFLMSTVVIYSMYGSPVFLAGAIACFLGGSSKVLWKLIVVLKEQDTEVLTKAFRILMFGGFAVMLLAVVISAVTDIINGIPPGPVKGAPGAGGTLADLRDALTMMPAALFFIAGIAGMCCMGYLGSHMDNSARSNWIEELTNAVSQAAILIGVIIVYFGMYYHASDAAFKALKSDENVNVTGIEEGYYFDGAGTDAALVFYPGAKVETEAYAPLMHMFAEKGVDCYLCRMPGNFALFEMDMAGEIQEEFREGDQEYTGTDNNYDRWYIGGHSLGGAAASMVVSDDSEDWYGLALLAAYPTEKISIPVLSIYGTEDTVLNSEKYGKAGSKGLWPDDFTELVIQGGNHAQFGCYGEQKGDGAAQITSDDQQAQTAAAIEEWYNGFREE